MELSEADRKRIEEEEAYRKQLRAEEDYRAQLRNTTSPVKKKWYKSSVSIVLLLIFFPPVGLFLMWKYLTCSKTKKWIITGVIVLVYIIRPVLGSIFTKSQSTVQTNQTKQETPLPTPEKQNTFVAYVNFKDGQFIISNIDKHTCDNARMQVNGDYSLDGYNLESALDSTVKTGTATVYKVGAGQFAKSDGTRFNPFTTKPQSFYIECRGNNELTSAYWYGSF